MIRAGRQLWLASLGAVASLPRVAARRRHRLRSLMDRLVEKGRPVAERHQARLRSLNDRADRGVEGAATLLRDTAAYESRQLLTRFDMATTDDLRRLAASLDALDRKLEDYRLLRAGGAEGNATRAGAASGAEVGNTTRVGAASGTEVGNATPAGAASGADVGNATRADAANGADAAIAPGPPSASP